MSQIIKKTKNTPELHYGMMSRWSDLMELNTAEYAPEWVSHVFDRSMTILQHKHPELLDQVRKVVKENFDG